MASKGAMVMVINEKVVVGSRRWAIARVEAWLRKAKAGRDSKVNLAADLEFISRGLLR